MALNLETGELTDTKSERSYDKLDSLEEAFRTYAPEITTFTYDQRRSILEFTVDTCGIFLFLNDCGIQYSYSRMLSFDDNDVPPLRVTVQVQSILSFFYRLIVKAQYDVSQKSSASR